ncbi:MAG: DUF357 domain-containing protein [Thermoprotei archaeon]
MSQRVKQLAEKYISNAETACHAGRVDAKALEQAKNYVADAKYYYSNKDYVTALVASSYAEGLIDGAASAKGLSPRWPVRSRKVLVVGTWDIVHPGHIEFLWRGKRLGTLYVIVARDENVERSKGRSPVVPERQRIEVVRNLKPVDFAVLGDRKDFLKPVTRIKPDVIVLGPDEPYPVERLRNELKSRGIKCKVIKLSKRFERYPLSSTSKILAKAAETVMRSRSQG